MLSRAAKQVACKNSVLIPLLSGLLLVAAIGLLGRQDGLLQKSVDTFLTAGFQKYSVGHDLYQRRGSVMSDTAISGGPAEAGTGYSSLKTPSWAGSFSLFLCVLVWLSLSALFTFRPSLVLAGTLTWIGGMLTASILLLFLEGTLVSPARPLIAAVLLFLFFFLLTRAKGIRDRMLRQKRRDGFQQKMLESLACVVETRDPAAGGHITRMQQYVRILAERLVHSGLYTETLTPEYRQLLVHLTPLHDIGKAGIRDEILLKPGRLTEGEYEEIKRHVEYGEAVLLGAARKEAEGKFLELARQIVATHHERWDGSGYPKGLSAEEIPLAGRILAVADVYDALISKRCYKAAYSHEQSRAILMKGRGSWFDPVIADAFKDINEEMWRISLDYRERSEISEFVHL